MLFAKRVFLAAGVWGLLILLPQYFVEERFGRDNPPPITHPEFYYGFIGVALSWQVAFLVLSRDPIRYRAMMVPAVLEKLGFGLAIPVLYGLGRVAGLMLVFAAIDLLLGVLFVLAFIATRNSTNATSS